jgi:hypothetical protein
MSSILLFFLIALQGPDYRQQVSEITLSKTIDESRMGIWTQGDYHIHIELNTLDSIFRNSYESYRTSNSYQQHQDTLTASFYAITSKRYLLAANQLKEASNGFDLRKLVLYFGQENERENSGNSFIVARQINHFVETGNAVVYYKGKRLQSLIRQMKMQGEGLNFGYTIMIYAEDSTNCVVQYDQHVGW